MNEFPSYLFVIFCEPWRYTFHCLIEFSLNFPQQTCFILTFFIMFTTMCPCYFFCDGCFQLKNWFIIFKKFCLPYFKLKRFTLSWIIYLFMQVILSSSNSTLNSISTPTQLHLHSKSIQLLQELSWRYTLYLVSIHPPTRILF